MLVLNEDAVIFLRKSVTMNNIKCLEKDKEILFTTYEEVKNFEVSVKR